jgi:hypothetical protein
MWLRWWLLLLGWGWLLLLLMLLLWWRSTVLLWWRPPMLLWWRSTVLLWWWSTVLLWWWSTVLLWRRPTMRWRSMVWVMMRRRMLLLHVLLLLLRWHAMPGRSSSIGHLPLRRWLLMLLRWRLMLLWWRLLMLLLRWWGCPVLLLVLQWHITRHLCLSRCRVVVIRRWWATSTRRRHWVLSRCSTVVVGRLCWTRLQRWLGWLLLLCPDRWTHSSLLNPNKRQRLLLRLCLRWTRRGLIAWLLLLL